MLQRQLFDTSPQAIANFMVSTDMMRQTNRPCLTVCYGVGRDSTAMIIKLWRLGIRPDLITFSDTGCEKQATYDYLPYFNDWLKGIGFPEITILNYADGSKYKSLEDECLRKRILPDIAFGGHSCSLKWKQSPFLKFMNRNLQARIEWKFGRKIVRAVGFESTECRRVKRAKTYAVKHPDRKYLTWFPLVEWGYTLEDCIAEIKAAGLLVPPKSSCYFCSAMKIPEIEQLASEEPEKFLAALRLEQNAIPRLTKLKGLGGRKFAWSDLDCSRPFLVQLNAKAA